jgi:putative transposase
MGCGAETGGSDEHTKQLSSENHLRRVGFSASSFYHIRTVAEDGDLRSVLLDLVVQYPTYGYRRLTAMLKRAGWTVNHKRIQRIMVEMGLQCPVKRPKKRTTNS